MWGHPFSPARQLLLPPLLLVQPPVLLLHPPHLLLHPPHLIVTNEKEERGLGVEKWVTWAYRVTCAWLCSLRCLKKKARLESTSLLSSLPACASPWLPENGTSRAPGLYLCSLLTFLSQYHKFITITSFSLITNTTWYHRANYHMADLWPST